MTDSWGQTRRNTHFGKTGQQLFSQNENELAAHFASGVTGAKTLKTWGVE
jgi:hypothetical protein